MSIASSFVRSVRISVRTAHILAALCLIVGILLNFANVIGRYFFHHAISWAEELMQYLMIAGVFLAAGSITLRGAHIRMDLAVQVMPKRLTVMLEAIAQVVFVVVAIMLIWLGIPVIMQLIAFGQVSEALRLPTAIPHSVIPVGFTIMILAVVARVIEGRWRAYEGEERK